MMCNRSAIRCKLAMLGSWLLLVLACVSAAEKSLETDIDAELKALSALQSNGKACQDEAKNLAANPDDESTAKAKELQAKAKAVFLEAAAGYEKLAVEKLANQHPADARAGMMFLSAGMNYMRAEEWNKANEAFDTVLKIDKVEADLCAQAMFWSALALEKQGGDEALPASYGLYKKITFEYPESKWAKFARGRLAEDRYKDLRGDGAPGP